MHDRPRERARPGACTVSSFYRRIITPAGAHAWFCPATAREDVMDARSRRDIEMGTRALEFSRAHPDTDTGYGVSAAKLEQLVARAGQIAAAQREGLIDTRAASARKADLRRAMLAGPIRHLAEVGQARGEGGPRAGHDVPIQAGRGHLPGVPDGCARHAGRGAGAPGSAGEARRVGVGAGAVRTDAGSVRRGGHARQ